MRSAIALCCLLVLASVARAADPPLWTVENLLQRIPPLRHDATGRWPMITWEPFVMAGEPQAFGQFKPLPAEAYRDLARRGLAQTIRFNEKYLPMAQAMQQAGVKVIAMEGGGGEGPGTEAPDSLHRFPAGVKVEGAVHACPLLFTGWHNRAMQVRELCAKFKAAGVNLDAAWLDWEHEPWWLEEEWQQSKQCTRCQTLFPPGVLDTHAAYRAYTIRLRQLLYSTYLAAPLLEAFPTCSVTNWTQIFSSPSYPNFSFGGGTPFPPMDIGLFNATNPVAYGVDTIYRTHWKRMWKNPDQTPLDQEHMDRAYTRIMLQQTSRDTANALDWAPYVLSFPWIARYCPDADDPKVPILSRDRYREILRHLWLRGADSMQIFCAYREKYPEIEMEEVEDAVTVYDEVLAFRPFLERGQVMCTDLPEVEGDAAIWSGLSLGDQALVRAFTMGQGNVRFTFKPWADGPEVRLYAPPRGRTYLLKRTGAQVAVNSP